jgi:hypothetical protein
MAQRETVDNLVRSALRTKVRSEEPSPASREALLAAAAVENTLRTALGPAVPPLVEGLQEQSEPAVEWGMPVTTAIPVARRQLLLLAAPLCAVR